MAFFGLTNTLGKSVPSVASADLCLISDLLVLLLLLWLKSWMKIQVESKDVLRIKKVFIEELSSAQTILITSHI